MNPNEEQNWAMFAHLAALALYIGIPFGNVLGPLVVWLVKRDESAIVDDHGKRSLNFQISMTLWMLCCVPLCLVFVGFILIPILAIVGLIYVILNGINASKGLPISYPLTINFIK